MPLPTPSNAFCDPLLVLTTMSISSAPRFSNGYYDSLRARDPGTGSQAPMKLAYKSSIIDSRLLDWHSALLKHSSTILNRYKPTTSEKTR